MSDNVSICFPMVLRVSYERNLLIPKGVVNHRLRNADQEAWETGYPAFSLHGLFMYQELGALSNTNLE